MNWPLRPLCPGIFSEQVLVGCHCFSGFIVDNNSEFGGKRKNLTMERREGTAHTMCANHFEIKHNKVFSFYITTIENQLFLKI